MNTIDQLLVKIGITNRDQIKSINNKLAEMGNNDKAVLVSASKIPQHYSYNLVRHEFAKDGGSLVNIVTPDKSVLKNIDLSSMKSAIYNHAKTLSLASVLINDDDCYFVERDIKGTLKEGEFAHLVTGKITSSGLGIEYKPVYAEKDVFIVTSRKSEDMSVFKDVVSTMMGYNGDKYINTASTTHVIEIEKTNDVLGWKYANHYGLADLAKKMKEWLPEKHSAGYEF